MKNVFVVALALLVSAGFAYAQDCEPKDCDSCPSKCSESKCSESKAEKAPVKTMKVSEGIAKLEAGAAKGCPTSSAKLDAMMKVAGAKDIADLKARVAAFEKYAPAGCDKSGATLAALREVCGCGKAAPAKKAKLSQRVMMLVKSSKSGCATSSAALKPLFAAAGTTCCKTLVADIQTLEAKADGGCAKCVDKLAMLEAKMPVRKAPLSTRVAMLVKSSESGCGKSNAALKPLYAAAGTECCKTLVSHIQTLEAKAGKGCGECVAKLAAYEKHMPAMKVAVPAKAAPAKTAGGTDSPTAAKDCSDCSDCTDCSDCSGCPGK